MQHENACAQQPRNLVFTGEPIATDRVRGCQRQGEPHEDLELGDLRCIRWRAQRLRR